jgi:hypothetical protein
MNTFGGNITDRAMLECGMMYLELHFGAVDE